MIVDQPKSTVITELQAAADPPVSMLLGTCMRGRLRAYRTPMRLSFISKKVTSYKLQSCAHIARNLVGRKSIDMVDLASRDVDTSAGA